MSRLLRLFTRSKSTLTSIPSTQSPKTPLIEYIETKPFVNPRISSSAMQLTALYNLGRIELPGSGVVPQFDCPCAPEKVKAVVAEPEVIKAEICEPDSADSKVDPIDAVRNSAMYAHIMLRIRKRKMKVHRRKRRYKKYAASMARSRFMVAKQTETDFRVTLMERIKQAKEFKAEDYMKNYLNDLKEPLIPLTYKGKKKPVWLTKNLLEQDKADLESSLANKLSLSGDDLVRDGETVQQFMQRTKSQLKPLPINN